MNPGVPTPCLDGGATLKKEGVGNRLEGGAETLLQREYLARQLLICPLS